MKYCSAIIVMFFILYTSDLSAARAWQPNLKISQIRIESSNVFVQFSPQPNNTCSLFGENTSFDYTTELGKALLSMLLVAKSSNNTVQIWYTESTAPGTDQANGCTVSSVAKLNGLRF